MNHVCAPQHAEIFNPLKGIHSGQSGIIYCTGPSLNDYKPIKGEKSAIKIGMKAIVHRQDLPVDYYFCGDLNVRTLDHLQLIKSLPSKKYAFTTVNGVKSGVLPSNFTDHFKHKERYWFTDELAEELGCEKVAVSCRAPCHVELDQYAFFKGSTVFPALQLALWTGIRRIFLVGADCTNVWSFREDSQRSQFKTFPDKMIPLWRQWRTYLREHYPKVRIISVNPIGLRGFFEDMWT